MTAAETLLGRLEGVRQTAPDRWLARCPAHADRHPSLSIRAADDRVLVNCKAGCQTYDVCAAVGLALADLFDERRGSPRPKRADHIPAVDVLRLVGQEILIVGIVATDFLEERTLSEDDWARLSTAISRIGRCAARVRDLHR